MRAKDRSAAVLEPGAHHAFKETYIENGRPVSKLVMGQLRQAKDKWSYKAADIRLNLDNHPNPSIASPGKIVSAKERERAEQLHPVHRWFVQEGQDWEADKLNREKKLEYLGPMLQGMPTDDEKQRRRFYVGNMSTDRPLPCRLLRQRC